MSKGYWAERQTKALNNLTDKSIKQTEAQLAIYYNRTMKKIIGQFELIYNELFSKLSEGKEISPADLYKLDSYWQIQGQLREELQKLGEYEIAALSKNFEKQYNSIYEAIAIKGLDTFSTADIDIAKQVINQIWCADGKSWSQRIWENTALLQETLNTTLVDCVIAGVKPTQLKQQLQERFGVSYSRANTLVRTEMSHLQNQAARQRYEDYGIQQVEVWADKDERRCEVCAKLHQTRYPVGGAMPIPAHPNCRCSLIPVVE
jgi:SPP1 gp7 family putative phage head morphogenesis protein